VLAATFVGCCSPGFHAITFFAPKGTTMKRLFAASQVMPFGLPSAAPCTATVARRPVILKIWSGPGCDIEPVGPNSIPVSVT
jgi:hypothetical protein